MSLLILWPVWSTQSYKTARGRQSEQAPLKAVCPKQNLKVSTAGTQWHWQETIWGTNWEDPRQGNVHWTERGGRLQVPGRKLGNNQEPSELMSFKEPLLSIFGKSLIMAGKSSLEASNNEKNNLLMVQWWAVAPSVSIWACEIRK